MDVIAAVPCIALAWLHAWHTVTLGTTLVNHLLMVGNVDACVLALGWAVLCNVL